MPGAGEGVGHQRREQAVDGPKQRENESWLQNACNETGRQLGIWMSGIPAGTSPMVWAPFNQRNPARVPTTSAARGPGRNLRTLLGQKMPTPKEIAPNAKAW